FVVTFLTERVGLTLITAGAVMATAQAAAIGGRILWGWVADRFVATRQLLGGLGWNGIYLAEVATLAPTGRAGMVTGGALSLTFLGIVIGPALFSAVVGASGSYRLAFLAAACCAAIAAV